MVITTTWTNNNPNTIYNRLATLLGRAPTDAEVRAEVHRILAAAKYAETAPRSGCGVSPRLTMAR